MLNDVISSEVLFKMRPHPIDFSLFTTEVGDKGINIFKDMYRNNLRVDVETLLSLLHHDSNDPNNLSEVIDHELFHFLGGYSMEDVARYFSDKNIFFKKVMDHKEMLKTLEKI